MQFPKILSKILFGDEMRVTRLGMPARDDAERLRRAQRMFEMTRGRGFRVEPDTPETDVNGLTRGDRKRLRRADANVREVTRQGAACARLIARGADPQTARQSFGSL